MMLAFTSERGGDSEIFTMKATPEASTNRPRNLTKTQLATSPLTGSRW